MQYPPPVKIGDIWRLGRHRLICGDSTRKDTLNALLDGVKVDISFNDPPYFVFGSSNGMLPSASDTAMIQPFFRLIAENLKNTLKERRGTFVCCDWRTYPVIFKIFSEYLSVRNCIVWDTKRLKMGNYFRSMHELIIYATNDYSSKKSVGNGFYSKINYLKIKGERPNVWQIPDTCFGGKKLHGSQKPVELIEYALDSYKEEKSETVLDMFAGSGTVLIACEKTDRTCYCAELDERLCNTIIRRWEHMTDGGAVKL